MTTLSPTLVRLSVNCWTDTAGRCYPIRPTAPTSVPRTSTCSQNWKSTNMRGVRFSALEDLSASVTRRVRQLNCSTDLTVIMDLPKRWDAVIRQKGDYTEDYNTFPHICCSILYVLRSVHFFWDHPRNYTSYQAVTSEGLSKVIVTKRNKGGKNCARHINLEAGSLICRSGAADSYFVLLT